MLRRLLFRAAKSNALLNYFQSMGDICAVFVVVYLEAAARSSANVDDVAQLSARAMALAEARSFRALCAFLRRFESIYIDSLDRDELAANIGDITTQLALINKPLVQRLQSAGIETSFWSFRWWFSLMSRELPLQSTLQLWLHYLSLPDSVDRFVFHK
jgi:hypothetical protein